MLLGRGLLLAVVGRRAIPQLITEQQSFVNDRDGRLLQDLCVGKAKGKAKAW